jgi:acetate kinase
LHGRYTQIAAEPRRSRVLSLHLGQGCSITAIRDGVPVETSMGYTPLEGLVMGTRPGDLDAGALVRLLRAGLGADEIDAGLQRESGLRGLSGASDDVRELLALEARGDSAAALALEVFCHRARKYAGAYAAVLGGVDAVLFGGGIGEHQPELRARICAGLAWLGLELDARANDAAIAEEARISAVSSRIAAYVIPVHEELAIARAAFATLGSENRDMPNFDGS